MTDLKRRQRSPSTSSHPYLSGNFAPVHRTQSLTPCSYSGDIPEELFGGEYVRNGGNPVTNEDLGRDAHWFDGDGMLSGVAFRRMDEKNGRVRPEFVNQFILTDLFLSSLTNPSLRTPILPSIATLVNPLSTLLAIILKILRTIFLVILSHISASQQAIRKISVANTGILYHDGRALATCESGPPIRVSLPGLETIGWFDGRHAEGEAKTGNHGETFGGSSMLGFMKEWTTAHPRVDPSTNELILFHSTFIPPYVHYSIVPSTHHLAPKTIPSSTLLNAAVPGVSSPKMMHDFGVSTSHTIILDLPLSLDPLNLARNLPVVSYNPSGVSRFGVFPRWQPKAVRWFETRPCCIFHTANTWDEPTLAGQDTPSAVNMLACRLTSASLVFSAGDIEVPVARLGPLEKQEEEQCRLYYYQFDLSIPTRNVIRHQWALSAVPFEFPSIRDDKSMSAARFVYGCSSASSFGAALGRAVKIDALVKMDVLTLIERGQQNPPTAISGSVDTRNLPEILHSREPNDPIQIFKMPAGWYAQESRFVPRSNGLSEDDGWLLTYVFDESQLDLSGNAPDDARSDLWVIDAKNMTDIVARVQLPQRVPYGLHGNWFSESEIQGQRPIETIRAIPPPEVVLGKPGRDSVWNWKSPWLLLRGILMELVH